MTASGGMRSRSGGWTRPLSGPRVVGVEVPPFAGRTCALHQQARLASHLAIEELHRQFGLAGRPVSEPRMRADEAVVLPDSDGCGGPLGEGGQRLRQPPLSAFGQEHPVDRLVGQRPLQLADNGAAVVGIVDPDVAHRDALSLQPLREVAHGREHQCDLLLVVPDIGGLVPHLGHQHHVSIGIQIAQGAEAVRQLIAEHQPQGARRARLGHERFSADLHRRTRGDAR